MRSVSMFVVTVFAASMLASGVKAEDQTQEYSADDIVSFMVEQADLGSARALCIGTKSECAELAPAPKGFDMLLTFDLDSSDLLPAAKAKLDIVAEALKDSRIRAAKFKVEGHTDAKGSEGYNGALSVERARAVTEYLVSLNVDRSRIIAIGHGETMPRTANPFDAENRRVELSLTVE